MIDHDLTPEELQFLADRFGFDCDDNLIKNFLRLVVNQLSESHVDQKQETMTMLCNLFAGINEFINDEFSTRMLVLEQKYGVDKVTDAITDVRRNLADTWRESKNQQYAFIILGKIEALLHVKSMSVIDQKIKYTKGICRNRFDYFNDGAAESMMREMVSCLKNKGCDDNVITEFFDEFIIPSTKEKYNWTQWKRLITESIEQVNKW